MRERITRLIAAAVLLMSLSGCFKGKKYNIDYCGQREFFEGAKDSYSAGERVKFYFNLVATDTDYEFLLDGERFNPDWDDNRGYVISFTMPDHDVTFKCRWENSMVRDGEILLVDYYRAIVGTDGGDSSYELALYRMGGGGLELREYTREAGGEEQVRTFSVPYSAKEDCYEVIDKSDFYKWESMDGIATDGAVTVVKYRENGGYIRVSSENMPEDGIEKMDRVRAALQEYSK